MAASAASVRHGSIHDQSSDKEELGSEVRPDTGRDRSRGKSALTPSCTCDHVLAEIDSLRSNANRPDDKKTHGAGLSMECRRFADPLGVMDGLAPREGYPGGRGGVFRACVAALLLWLTAPVQAQHNHAQGHPDYQHWVNKVGRECCNGQDCGELREQDERTTATGGVEVRVEGKWCPIKPHHYLQTENAPNWSTSHVCVLKAAPWQIMPVCDRLLCYQPKPGI